MADKNDTGSSAEPAAQSKPRGAARFPDAAKDAANKALAEAAQALAEKAGLRSRYLSGEAAEFRALYEAAKERGAVTIKRRDSGQEAKVKAADLREWALDGDAPKEAAAALREIASPPKLIGRKLAIYAYVAVEDKSIREVI
jgi:hypothetical protein